MNTARNRKRLQVLFFNRIREELSAQDPSGRSFILSLSFQELLDALKTEKVTAVMAVEAYRWKALECHDKYNCLMEFIKEAPEWAKELDDAYKGIAGLVSGDGMIRPAVASATPTVIRGSAADLRAI